MTTAISVKDGRRIVDGMKILAIKKGESVAQLVHDALIKTYGDELDEVASFFADSVESIQHNSTLENSS